MKKIELHFHTAQSSPCGKVDAAEGVRLYRQKGFQGVAVTDHFSKSVWGGPEGMAWSSVREQFLEGWRQACRAAETQEGEEPFSVFLGMEIRFPFDENDFLVYGMDEEFFTRYPWLFMEDQKTVYEIGEKEGLFMAQAHPFRKSCFPGDTRCLHGIEVYNGNPRHDSRNPLAKALAEKTGLRQTVGSDFHQMGDFSGMYTSLEQIPADGRELARMLREGQFGAGTL